MKINILMIDDNINLIEMVKEYFKQSEEVNILFEAHDGEEGINEIEKNKDKIDLIILDLIMPNKDGIYVLNEMKKRNINKKVIVATSYNAAEVIREVSEYGVSYYILKPFDLSDLEKRINSRAESNTDIRNLANSVVGKLEQIDKLVNDDSYFNLSDATVRATYNEQMRDAKNKFYVARKFMEAEAEWKTEQDSYEKDSENRRNDVRQLRKARREGSRGSARSCVRKRQPRRRLRLGGTLRRSLRL